MEMLSTRIPDNNNRLLYINDQMSGLYLYYSLRYRGYRKDYLLENLTELEENYVICPKCEGIMRDAVVDSSCISCKLCSESKDEPFQKVRDSISKLEVRCPLQRDCEWIGILSQAEQHLDVCEYFRVKCPLNCRKVMMRSDIDIHTETSCPLREISCRYCQKTGVARDLAKHWNLCQKYPVICPNGCKDRIPRGDIWEHNRTCCMFELMCPFDELDGGNIFCSDHTFYRGEIPEHNRWEHVVHLDMLHLKVLHLEDKLNEMELKLKCKKDLDGCEWEIENPFTVDTEYREGPEFYVYGYKLIILCRMKEGRSVSFQLTRREGDNDDNLAGATITECRKVLIDRNNPSNSKFQSFNLDYELEIDTESEYFGTTRIPQSDTNPLFRFYFDINNTQLGDIKSSYEKQVEPVPTTF